MTGLAEGAHPTDAVISRVTTITTFYYFSPGSRITFRHALLYAGFRIQSGESIVSHTFKMASGSQYSIPGSDAALTVEEIQQPRKGDIVAALSSECNSLREPNLRLHPSNCNTNVHRISDVISRGLTHHAQRP